MIPVESRLRVRGFWGRHTRERRLKQLSELSEDTRLRLRREAETLRGGLKEMRLSHRRLISDVRRKMY